eukprot:GGOE01018168.1.p3 GENE.GGOE01018168.1~~GGOE01018168.1.p3  ORF type:complete len:129 (+),score=8.44 GGOE01018168.1:51-437(+)
MADSMDQFMAAREQGPAGVVGIPGSAPRWSLARKQRVPDAPMSGIASGMTPMQELSDNRLTGAARKHFPECRSDEMMYRRGTHFVSAPQEQVRSHAKRVFPNAVTSDPDFPLRRPGAAKPTTAPPGFP